ncbi:hypothetical protein OCH239_18835 [Roseivivax halodurans JCM 10272]|uniref:Uncharacterized protein n=1 Tax=Roseivivax halodurans JCM 10272 TaxID=1449350 RepID=X7EA34_9RHOB|nr:hypothetical protein [Roseivivax halodurans]ETX11978.1 hypothetical protein OCH239_18835 [Roseivivax halodurans JCM 10272]
MSDAVSRTLFEQQVDLTSILLQRMQGIESHLLTRVRPHLSDSAGNVVDDLIVALDVDEWIDPNLHFYIDAVLGEMRTAIAAGTTNEQVPIPRDQLIGCTVAFDTRTAPSPAAEALQAALPPLERLYDAAREALRFAEAIRLSFQLLHPD